ncbi:MAG: type II secretion system F family protein [Pseudomonadota bacterium]
MNELTNIIDPLLLLSACGGLAVFGLIYALFQYSSQTRSRSDVKKRLSAKEHDDRVSATTHQQPEPATKKRKMSKKVAQRANDFYSSSDPNTVKKLRMLLMQAGYMNPNSVGYFIAARFASAAIGLLVGIVLVILILTDKSTAYKAMSVLSLVAIGYFLPNIYLSRRAAAIELNNRQGFPDILDLMVVSAEAGLTMEASIERITEEIKELYPNLAMQLNMASLEIRAGRPIDQALRAFGERLNLDEVKGFATMVQQAKELGTSVSDALRVYSDEMRHKRMMAAEEKAYALPAKMSIPVTLFILPIVIGIAIIPTIVRFNV